MLRAQINLEQKDLITSEIFNFFCLVVGWFVKEHTWHINHKDCTDPPPYYPLATPLGGQLVFSSSLTTETPHWVRVWLIGKTCRKKAFIQWLYHRKCPLSTFTLFLFKAIFNAFKAYIVSVCVPLHCYSDALPTELQGSKKGNWVLFI